MSLSIGQVADRTGLSVHALRYYEREGLLAAQVDRGPGGRRAYTEFDVAWLAVCIRLRDSQMPLAAIRAYADLVRAGLGNEEERLGLLREHQARVTAQIAELTECLAVIGCKVTLYEERLASGSRVTNSAFLSEEDER